MKRKNMGDLKKDIAGTASTSKEIIQSICQDVKAEAQKKADMADEFRQSAITKTKNAADDIKKGAQDVGEDVAQTAANVSQSVTASEPPHQTEKTDRKQS